MSAVERIQAAIDSLERVKTHLTAVQGLHVDGFSAGLVGYEDLLLGTIDAQLAILRYGLGGTNDLSRGASPDEPAGTDVALALADAILAPH